MTEFEYLGLDPDSPLDQRDREHVPHLHRIAREVGYGRAQQLVGLMWDHDHRVAPRGAMGVSVPTAGHERAVRLLRQLRTARPLLLYGEPWIADIEAVLAEVDAAEAGAP